VLKIPATKLRYFVAQEDRDKLRAVTMKNVPIQFSKSDWEKVGKKAGWLKQSMAIEIPRETEEFLSKYDNRYIQETLNDIKTIQAYQPKINSTLSRYKTVVDSANTIEEMWGLIPDIIPVLSGLRKLYVSFYQGLKALREKGSLVELTPLIKSIYGTVEEIYTTEKNYSEWQNSDISTMTEESKKMFLLSSKYLPKQFERRSLDILNHANEVQKKFSTLVAKEETPPTPQPEEIKNTPSAPEVKNEEIPDPVAGQRFNIVDIDTGKVLKPVVVKEVNAEKGTVTFDGLDGTEFSPSLISNFKKAILKKKMVPAQIA